MRERPIPFRGPMVSALLADRKTQTRRLVKLDQPNCWEPAAQDAGDLSLWHFRQKSSPPTILKVRCRYGGPGSILWVKETWKYADWTEDGVPWIEYAAGGRMLREPSEEWGDRVSDIWAELSVPNSDGPACDKRWRPSIHMPRWASRLTLEVVSVRVERVQDISEEDAIAEGFAQSRERVGNGINWESARGAFLHTFYDLNKRAPRDANPWVWVVEFRRVTP